MRRVLVIGTLLFFATTALACTWYTILTISITSPKEAAVLSGGRTVTVTGTTTSRFFRAPWVTLSVNGEFAAVATWSSTGWSANVELAEGDNTIVATAHLWYWYRIRTRVHVVYQAQQDQGEKVSVAITSPSPGQSFTGDRITTVSGTVTGTAPSVAVAVNGGAPVAASVSDGTFSASVQLSDGDNTIVATATTAAGSATASVAVAYQPVITPPPPPPPPPVITVSAPLEGAVVLGSRTVTVSGTLTGATSPVVNVTVNDGSAVVAAVSGDTFRADVQLGDRVNALVASVTATEGTASTTVLVTYPFLSLDTFQPADRVIGRPSLTTAAPTPCDDPAAPITSDNVCYPFGSAGWDGTTLFVSDWPRNRVLAFPGGIPAEDGATAAFALGQSTMSTSGLSSRADGLGGPETVRVQDGKLFLAEYANNRLLVFDPIPSGFSPATVAVGAPSPDVPGLGTCARDSLLRPESFIVVGGRLLVADPGNNRVLVWNQIPTVSGAPADLVLGQPNFTTCDANSGGVSARSLAWPTDVWSDGTRIFVADYMNNRILGWSTFPTASNTPADIVLGQPGFDAAAPATARTGLQFPYFLASNGNQLFVADQWNSRVLVWNSLPAASGALPDVVLGQADFDHGTQNDDDQDGMTDASLTARTLLWPAGVTVLDDALLVTDEGNSRYLVFRAR